VISEKFFLNVFSTSSNVAGDVCSTLFGSTKFLTLTTLEVVTCVVLSIVVITLYLAFFNKIFSVTFDENFAGASGLRVGVYNLLIATVTAIVIVLAMKLVGSLLISALIVFPALSAIRLFKSYKKVIIFASIIGVINSIFGILVSILWGTPVGATIVIVDIFVYVICWLIDIITRNLKRA